MKIEVGKSYICRKTTFNKNILVWKIGKLYEVTGVRPDWLHPKDVQQTSITISTEQKLSEKISCSEFKKTFLIGQSLRKFKLIRLKNKKLNS